jgi:Fur family ferric uptake transcriptional regulator
MNDFKNRLKDSSLRLTPAREELMDVFINSSKPLSYEDIKDDLEMDKATFYRNISKFEEQGFIHSLESHDKKRYFEITSTPHAHFICSTCNNITCMKLGNDVFDIKGYKIEDVILKGVCPSCLA